MSEEFYISEIKQHVELSIIHDCNKYVSNYDVNGGDYQWGRALDKYIYYNPYHNNFLISNGEYSSIVNYCP